MKKKRVLFICKTNSARSQMAEAYMNQLWGNSYDVKSAGIFEKRIHPLVLKALSQDGIDISGKTSKTIEQLLMDGTEFDLVIAVCSKKTAELCPAFQNAPVQIFWDIPDPLEDESVSADNLLDKIIKTREIVKSKIKEMVLDDYLKNDHHGVWIKG